MKYPESVDMAEFTAFVHSLSQRVHSGSVRVVLAAAIVLVGLYLYLVPNSITVSFPRNYLISTYTN